MKFFILLWIIISLSCVTRSEFFATKLSEIEEMGISKNEIVKIDTINSPDGKFYKVIYKNKQ